MKPCSQVRGFGTNFHNYVLPLYSLFGNVNGTLYVCIRPHYRVSRLKVWNGYRWVDTTTKDHPDIRHFIIAFMNSADFISEEPVKCRRDTRAIASMLPREKKHPQPMYGSKSGCTHRHELTVRAITSHGKKIPNLYRSWLPVKYSEGHRLPPVGFNSFEGYTDTPEARRRDGMKIKQIKCRPGKVYVVETQAKK